MKIRTMAKFIHGIYDDEVPLLRAVKALRSAGVHIKDVYTPFPVHGLDDALGVPRTRLAVVSFLFGMTGVTLSLLMMWYMMIYDWPINFGGKPNFRFIFNLPAFIPVTFESGVLLAAHGMAFTFLLRSWLLPGVTPKNPDSRTTDDKSLIEIEITDGMNQDNISLLMKENGASEINFV